MRSGLFGVIGVLGGSFSGFFLSLSALVILAAAGCCAPALPDRAGPHPSAARILEVFRRDHDGWHTLRASVSGSSDRGSFSGILFADRDRRLFHMYTWKLGGAIPIFDLLVAKERLSLVVPRTRRRFDASLDDVKYAKLDREEWMPLASYVDSLLAPGAGAERFIAPDSRLEISAWDSPGRPVAGSGWSYSLAPGTLALERQRLICTTGAAPPGTRIQVDYGDPALFPGGRIWPTSMSMRRPKDPADRALRLAFGDIVFDEPIDPRKFEQRIPEGTVRVKTLAELGVE